jgi:hypothetical protein
MRLLGKYDPYKGIKRYILCMRFLMKCKKTLSDWYFYNEKL